MLHCAQLEFLQHVHTTYVNECWYSTIPMWTKYEPSITCLQHVRTHLRENLLKRRKQITYWVGKLTSGGVLSLPWNPIGLHTKKKSALWWSIPSRRNIQSNVFPSCILSHWAGKTSPDMRDRERMGISRVIESLTLDAGFFVVYGISHIRTETQTFSCMVYQNWTVICKPIGGYFNHAHSHNFFRNEKHAVTTLEK